MAEPDRSDPSSDLRDSPPPARRFRLPPRPVLAWFGFGLVLVLLVAYLIVPTFRYGANLSPPGPANWDQPQASARPATKPRPAPKVETPPPPVAEDNGAAPADQGNEAAGGEVTTEAASTVPADEADMLAAIDHARLRALDSGKPKHWDGGGREGYVVPSEPISDGTRECRNLVVTVITADGQPRSSTDRYCRDDEESDWRQQ